MKRALHPDPTELSGLGSSTLQSGVKANSIRAITAGDLADLAPLGLDQVTALRAMAQDMAWLVDEAGIRACATACLADGCVLVDCLVGDDHNRLTLIDHIISYACWSFAPAIIVPRSAHPALVEVRGFVGLEAEKAPIELTATLQGRPLLMKRL